MFAYGGCRKRRDKTDTAFCRLRRTTATNGRLTRPIEPKSALSRTPSDPLSKSTRMEIEHNPCHRRRWELVRHNSSREGNSSKPFHLYHEPLLHRRRMDLSFRRHRRLLSHFTTYNLLHQRCRRLLRLRRTSSNRWRRCILGHRHPCRRGRWSANSFRMDHFSGCVCKSLGRLFRFMVVVSHRHRCLAWTAANTCDRWPRLWETI